MKFYGLCLLEFNGTYFDQNRQGKWTASQKKQFNIYERSATEELLKSPNDTDQTGLEVRCLTIARQTSCINYAINNWLFIVKDPVSFIKDKHRASFQRLKLYNMKTQNI